MSRLVRYKWGLAMLYPMHEKLRGNHVPGHVNYVGDTNDLACGPPTPSPGLSIGAAYLSGWEV